MDADGHFFNELPPFKQIFDSVRRFKDEFNKG